MNLIRLLELIDECGSIWAAKIQFMQQTEFANGLQNQQQIMDRFSSRLCDLRKLGINPVCLPSEWGINRLLNLNGMMEEYLKLSIMGRKRRR
ncbi:hypothetical protein D3C84_574500 [compost metagenome]